MQRVAWTVIYDAESARKWERSKATVSIEKQSTHSLLDGRKGVHDSL